jgi:hypothetical protein
MSDGKSSGKKGGSRDYHRKQWEKVLSIVRREMGHLAKRAQEDPKFAPQYASLLAEWEALGEFYAVTGAYPWKAAWEFLHKRVNPAKFPFELKWLQDKAQYRSERYDEAKRYVLELADMADKAVSEEVASAAYEEIAEAVRKATEEEDPKILFDAFLVSGSEEEAKDEDESVEKKPEADPIAELSNALKRMRDIKHELYLMAKVPWLERMHGKWARGGSDLADRMAQAIDDAKNTDKKSPWQRVKAARHAESLLEEIQEDARGEERQNDLSRWGFGGSSAQEEEEQPKPVVDTVDSRAILKKTVEEYGDKERVEREPPRRRKTRSSADNAAIEDSLAGEY